ncbi:MAG TPA: hypothetical protein DEB31_03110 [Clostridiales bacterium]|nr:hypothetical protein [Clostridiales bacterium]
MQDEKNTKTTTQGETAEENDIVVTAAPGPGGDEEPEMEIRNADEVADEEPVEPEPYVPKLTPSQQKFWQIFLGIAFGAGIMIALFSGAYIDPENQLFSWLWLILFAAAMLGRNQVEKRTGIRLMYFMRALLISMIIALGIFLIFGAATGRFTAPQ